MYLEAEGASSLDMRQGSSGLGSQAEPEERERTEKLYERKVWKLHQSQQPISHPLLKR